jgi:hypothetical protein
MEVRGYLHEVWLHCSASGEALESCLPWGPRGDDAKALTQKIEGGSGSCLWVFWADTHHEAMSVYNEFLEREKYVATDSEDFTRYPAEWYAEQAEHLATVGDRRREVG